MPHHGTLYLLLPSLTFVYVLYSLGLAYHLTNSSSAPSHISRRRPVQAIRTLAVSLLHHPRFFKMETTYWPPAAKATLRPGTGQLHAEQPQIRFCLQGSRPVVKGARGIRFGPCGDNDTETLWQL